MNKNKIKNFINGYIVVNIEGLNPEKFINLSAKSGVFMWDIQKKSFTTIELKMYTYQYKLLKNITKKTGCRCRITKKYGMNFLLFEMNKRKYFVFGIIIFISLILYLSSFVWMIEIDGNKNIDSNKIYTAIGNAGLKKGIQKKKINLRNVENSVQNQILEISVINIKFAGTKAKIEIVERTMPPVVDNNKPVDIVASKDGIIMNVLTYKGQAIVNNGDFVKKEQVLISGILTNSQNAALGFVHAKGIVTAKTWYESIQEVPVNYTYQEKTGREKSIIYFKTGEKCIYIKNDNIDFKKYGKIEEKHFISIAGYDTPVEKITQTYYELKDCTKKLEYDQALAIAEENAQVDINKKMPQGAKLIDRKVQRQIGNGKATVKLLYIMEENIGSPREIK